MDAAGTCAAVWNATDHGRAAARVVGVGKPGAETCTSRRVGIAGVARGGLAALGLARLGWAWGAVPRVGRGAGRGPGGSPRSGLAAACPRPELGLHRSGSAGRPDVGFARAFRSRGSARA